MDDEEPTAARSKPNQYSGRMGSALLDQRTESLGGRTQKVGLSSRKQGRKRARSYQEKIVTSLTKRKTPGHCPGLCCLSRVSRPISRTCSSGQRGRCCRYNFNVISFCSLSAFDCTLRCNSGCTSFYRSSTFHIAWRKTPDTTASVQMRELARLLR